MHEMSLAESALQIIQDHAARQGFSRVTTVWLEIGQLACVEVEALRFCFDAVTRGSLAEGARLEIVTTLGQGHCLNCGWRGQLEARHALCPDCDFPVEATGGMEMRVKELEVA